MLAKTETQVPKCRQPILYFRLRGELLPIAMILDWILDENKLIKYNN